VPSHAAGEGANHTRRTAGFSLIEVFVALGVLAFGLLSLAVMQVTSLREGSAGKHASDALLIAKSQMEILQRMDFGDLEDEVDVGWQAPDWIAFAGYDVGEFPIQVRVVGGGTQIEQTYDVAYRVTEVTGNNNLLNIEVEVTWSERNRPNQKPTRTGLPTVTLSSVRYDW
jgi:Tfp pilus assembly protein PilV